MSTLSWRCRGGGASVWEDLRQGGGEGLGDLGGFGGSEDEGWGEEEVVAARAVEAALGGVGEDAGVHGGGADFFGDGLLRVEGSARGFVLNEFDGEEEALAADVADVGMSGERSESGTEGFGGGRDGGEEIVGFKVVEDGIAGGGGNGMGLVGKAVFERAGTLRKNFRDFGGDEDGAKGSVAAGDALSREDEVGLEVGVLDGEGFAGAAEAGHDFVGDEKKVVPASDFTDARKVGGIGRSSGAEGGANYGFEEEGGGGRIGLGEMRCEIVGAGEVALREGLVEGTVVAEAGSDVAPLLKKRCVGSAASEVARDGHSAEGRAVVALAAGEDAVALGLAEFEEVLADEFDGGFGGFGTAGSEVDAAVLKIGRSEGEEAGGEFFGGSVVELRGVGEGELRGLGGNGGGDFGDAVANVDDRGGAGGVEKFATVLGIEPAALAADGDGKVLAKIAREERGSVGHAGSGGL